MKKIALLFLALIAIVVMAAAPPFQPRPLLIDPTNAVPVSPAGFFASNRAAIVSAAAGTNGAWFSVTNDSGGIKLVGDVTTRDNQSSYPKMFYGFDEAGTKTFHNYGIGLWYGEMIGTYYNIDLTPGYGIGLETSEWTPPAIGRHVNFSVDTNTIAARLWASDTFLPLGGGVMTGKLSFSGAAGYLTVPTITNGPVNEEAGELWRDPAGGLYYYDSSESGRMATRGYVTSTVPWYAIPTNQLQPLISGYGNVDTNGTATRPWVTNEIAERTFNAVAGYGTTLTTNVGDIAYNIDTNVTATVEYVNSMVRGGLVYLLQTNVADVAGYYYMRTSTTEATSTITVSSVTNNQYVFTFITPTNEPGLAVLREGLYHVDIMASRGAAGGATLKAEIYLMNTNGVEYYELPEGQVTVALTTTLTRYELSIFVSSNVPIAIGDRLVVKIKATVTSGSPTVNIQVGGNVLSHFETPLTSATASTYVFNANQFDVSGANVQVKSGATLTNINATFNYLSVPLRYSVFDPASAVTQPSLFLWTDGDVSFMPYYYDGGGGGETNGASYHRIAEYANLTANNTYNVSVLAPDATGTNFVLNFNYPSMVVQMTNHCTFLQSTGRAASASRAMFSDVTIINDSGSSYVIRFPSDWVKIGSTNYVPLTNATGKIVHISAMNKRGTSESNVIYGVTFQP